MKRDFADRELLDIPGKATRSEIEGNLRDIARANKWLGATSIILNHTRRLLDKTSSPQPINILDLGTGSADIPISIANWAHRYGIKVSITGVDRNPDVIEIARSNTKSFPEISIEEYDILELPYKKNTFDIVLFSQVLHHLDDSQVRTVLRSANQLASQGIIVSDLHRHPLCIYLADLASNFISNPLSRHDVRVSFRNAFTARELLELAKEVQLPCVHIHHHAPCRLSMISDKRNVLCDGNLKTLFDAA